MNNQLSEFIEKARAKGLADDAIRAKLVAAGWEASEVDSALGDDLVVPLPPSRQAASSNPQTGNAGLAVNGEAQSHAMPISVVENLTPRGFEYKIFSVSLVLSLLALILIANFLFGAEDNWNASAFPLTMLIVSGPIALLLFMRLRRAEKNQPSLKRDASRRKVLQAIQLVTFLAVIGHTIALLYMIISGHFSGSSMAGADGDHPSLLLAVLRWLITLVVAGGTFMYYWRDEHRNAN